MTSQTSEIPPADKRFFLMNIIQRWMTPHSTDRDAAFRERIIRGSLLIILVLFCISLSFNIFVFNAGWALISFRTLHIISILGLLIAAAAVTNRQLVASGLSLVITVLLSSGGLILLARQDVSLSTILLGVPAFMLAPLVATLVLPRNYILPTTVVTVVMYVIAQFAVPINATPIPGITADQVAGAIAVLLLVEGVLLLQLRFEFDSRLLATEHAVEQAELARQQAEADRHRAEEADRAKTSFLANMSHELRTPMNAVIGYDEAMLGGMVGEFTPEQTKLLRHIQHNSRRLLGLINDVLDLSKIEAGSVDLYLAPISPRKVIEQTVDSLHSLAFEKNITLEATFDDSVPGVILGDTKKLQQILVNLIGNAIKFTEQGGVTVEVTLVNSENWQFKVRDTGIGIPPDAQTGIFEPFRQVDNSATRKYKGTGLGLSITKRLVELLNGKLELTSELGKGSTFAVTLPRVNAPVETETAGQEIK